METKPKYITIAQAKKEYADYSVPWYYLKLREGRIKAIGGNSGEKWLIDRESLESYLETASQPMGG